ncbi:MAG: 3-deoxy-manno-octulosonate cytidylyltransferase [Halobacteriovoraceae bacterium]|jgi:3-deoxy-manno-octulosonate cytidylyltransferase (CMP-KDO synthetase)|nr:3-deoxy-manno-octulosonate cytidylyltransferase [Halobacteriovoraceae bacterium]
MSNFLILVPARFGSSRFPGKPLAKIFDKPMIQYVVENCQASGFDYAVVTDDQKIEDAVIAFDGNVVRVDDDVPTGSERIALAYDRFYAHKNYQYIINVQGDEPLLTGSIIKDLGSSHASSPFDIYTAVKERSASDEEFLNPNIVKCVKSKLSDQCLYFSRQPIPFDRNQEMKTWYQHIGVYSYKVDALKSFVTMPQSEYEKIEKLEQLRALENGLTIGAKTIDVNLYGVDAPEDIKKIEGVLGEQKK